ncbi:hypothetical protein [Actinomadura sp. NTSP31]|uniref:hypothetical protein n=1 Tax=Actinomadura sp. NTSP31 TaxID=1735447 RepID=UPI0035BF9378
MTENSIHRMLNTTYNPPTPRPSATPPAGPPGGAAGTSAMDPTALRTAAKTIPEVETQVRSGARVFPGETDRAAAALGEGWATAAAMKKISSQWSQALRRLADEADFLGDAVEKSARNRQWAETEIQQRIAQIRTGAH